MKQILLVFLSLFIGFKAYSQQNIVFNLDQFYRVSRTGEVPDDSYKVNCGSITVKVIDEYNSSVGLSLSTDMNNHLKIKYQNYDGSISYFLDNFTTWTLYPKNNAEDVDEVVVITYSKPGGRAHVWLRAHGVVYWFGSTTKTY